MIEYEIERQTILLAEKREELTFHFHKHFKKEDIKWMEYNQIPTADIVEIYPDYVPKQLRDMYLPQVVTKKKAKKKLVAKKVQKEIKLHPSITPGNKYDADND
jgi:hypothetical protein